MTMSGSRVALVAEDQRVTQMLGVHFRAAFDVPPLACDAQAARRHLGPDADGLLVLAAAAPAQAAPLVHLVQEVYLRQLPPLLFLVDLGPGDGLAEFTALDPYVSARLRWPDQADLLFRMVRDRLGRVRGFPGADVEPVAQGIRRRLLSTTPSLAPLAERLALAAQHDVTVLLTGETGTGKTFLARLLHDCSPRREHPFLVVPCGAQPANLIESTFFGHVKGAFTGADRDRPGKFAAAGRGTILLDEIDTLGLEQQASLLRVIETGEYEPVGSNETKLSHARIVVASNRDLEEAAGRGLMRQDLYYRLNVISFHLPPLCERVEDIAPLVRGLAARFNAKFRKELFAIHPETMAALELFPWPGNIRQLENFVQQAVLLSSGPELLLEHLPQVVRDHLRRCQGESTELGALALDRQSHERAVIQRTLANHGYSRSRTAHALGISRVTLYKKMKKYGLMNGAG
jgi:DNA-binding NtrC family response regulator